MTFVEFSFDLKSISNSDGEILIAQLSDLGFDSFENTDRNLKAYILNDKINEGLLGKIRNNLVIKNLDFELQNLESKNWNNTWESNFQPVFFQSGVIRASFHFIKKKPKYDIIINPKMSFGTGHHETTKLMIDALFSLECNPNKILDFGCGTAILSILSEKIWKANILALDTDEWAFKNAKENLDLNFCRNIEVKNCSINQISNQNKFDLILANINTNVLIEFFSYMKNFLKKDGILILSGFYSSDFSKINKEAYSFGCSLINKFEDNDWQCVVYQN